MKIINGFSSVIVLGLTCLVANALLLSISGWFITACAITGVSGILINYYSPAAAIRFLAITRVASRYAEKVLGHIKTQIWVINYRSKLIINLARLNIGDLFNKTQKPWLDSWISDCAALEKYILNGYLPAVTAFTSLILITIIIGYFSLSLALVLITGLLLNILYKSPINYFQYAARQAATELWRMDDFLEANKINKINVSAQIIHFHNQNAMQDFELANIQGKSQFISSLGLIIGLLLLPNTGLNIDKAIFVLFLLWVGLEISGLISISCWHEDIFKSSIARTKINVQKSAHCQQNSSSNVSISPTIKIGGKYDLTAEIGDLVIITGPSGAGKTMLLNEIAGFFEGEVTINNQKPHLFSDKQRSSLLCYVTQHSRLIRASLLDNLKISNPNSTKESVINVLSTIGLYDWLNSSEKGIDTIIEAEESLVSGGEAKRMHIARLLLSNAPIWLIDEPEAYLDDHNSRLVRESIIKASDAKLLIVSTHDPLAWQKLKKAITISL